MSGWHVASVQAPIVNSDPVNGHQYQGWRPCMEWCVRTFGGGIGATSFGPGWRFVGEGVFEFREQPDLTAFLLRWA
jgi:hypothetical protein